MRTLVIDTATPACSVALFDGSSLIEGHYEEIGRGHAERLVPMISLLPQQGRADQIYVNAGPGSFTGIRVGVSAARGLAYAWKIPCFGYSCMSLVAAMAASNSPVDVVMQAGHGEFFFQPFGKVTGRDFDPVSLPPQQAAALSTAPIVVGSAAQELVELRGDGSAVVLLPDARKWPKIAKKTPIAVKPVYVRDADAKLPEPK